jgi:hypothetical protein
VRDNEFDRLSQISERLVMTGSTIYRPLLSAFSIIAAGLVILGSLWVAFSPHGNLVAGLALCVLAAAAIGLSVGVDRWQRRRDGVLPGL